MTFVPQRPCTYPGCGTLVPSTAPGAPRCPMHPYPVRARAQAQRPNKITRGYGKDWERLRNWYLSDHPVCEIRTHCRGEAATEVDHVIPISQGGARLDQGNLQATCRRCHNAKTGRQRRGGTA
ncbi:MAG: HNH endonuclease [Gammaproteobacteria bacterium]|nr:HNH endonuclease [Gammaproteobacteria bacterium]